MNDALLLLPRQDRRKALAEERRRRRSGRWPVWETIRFAPGTAGPSGWPASVTCAHRNGIFCVLDRPDFSGARHLAVSSLTGERPTWHEMQRIKDEIAGPGATAVEVYPPSAEVVDGADMYHLWVLPAPLPFSLHSRCKEADL